MSEHDIACRRGRRPDAQPRRRPRAAAALDLGALDLGDDDYRTNVAAYPAWQAWMRQHQPPMLVVWGKYDPSFAVGGAAAYQGDVPGAEVHVLDAGHFALEEKVDEIAALMRAFLGRRVPQSASRAR